MHAREPFHPALGGGLARAFHVYYPMSYSEQVSLSVHRQSGPTGPDPESEGATQVAATAGLPGYPTPEAPGRN